jgi:hypothetical protein
MGLLMKMTGNSSKAASRSKAAASRTALRMVLQVNANIRFTLCRIAYQKVSILIFSNYLFNIERINLWRPRQTEINPLESVDLPLPDLHNGCSGPV